MGSDILTDDGVGLHVVRRLGSRSLPESVDVVELGTAGLGLLETVRGYDRLILVDAIVTGAEPGTLHVLDGADVARASHLGAGHDADLPTVLALGEKLVGDEMPREVIVVAVEAADVHSVSTQLSPAVEVAISNAVRTVEQLCS